MKKRNNVIVIIFMFIIMLLISMGDNVRGVFIPVFKKYFNVNDTYMGLMLTVSSLGYMTFTFLGGILCEKIGQKKVMILGLLSSIIAMLILYISPNFTILLIGMFIINMGVSLMAIGVNTLIPVLSIGFQAILMNMIHSFYGVGATVTQRLAGLLLFEGVGWRTIYLYMMGIFIFVLLIFSFIKIPEPDKVSNNKKIDWNYILKNKLTYFYMIALGLYVSAEMSTSNWFINFMRESYGFNENESAFYSSLFLGIFTFGRIIGGFIVERIGHLKSVVISSSLATILYSAGIILGKEGLIIISISGLFFSITFPTLVVTINKVFTKNSSFITGFVITVASGISMVVNFLIGVFNDLIGTYNSYYLIATSLLISTLFTILILKSTKGVKME